MNTSFWHAWLATLVGFEIRYFSKTIQGFKIFCCFGYIFQLELSWSLLKKDCSETSIGFTNYMGKKLSQFLTISHLICELLYWSPCRIGKRSLTGTCLEKGLISPPSLSPLWQCNYWCQREIPIALLFIEIFLSLSNIAFQKIKS